MVESRSPESLYRPDKDLHVQLLAYDARAGTITLRINGILTQYEVRGDVEHIVRTVKTHLTMNSTRIALAEIRKYQKPNTDARVDIYDGDLVKNL